MADLADQCQSPNIDLVVVFKQVISESTSKIEVAVPPQVQASEENNISVEGALLAVPISFVPPENVLADAATPHVAAECKKALRNSIIVGELFNQTFELLDNIDIDKIELPHTEGSAGHAHQLSFRERLQDNNRAQGSSGKRKKELTSNDKNGKKSCGEVLGRRMENNLMKAVPKKTCNEKEMVSETDHQMEGEVMNECLAEVTKVFGFDLNKPMEGSSDAEASSNVEKNDDEEEDGDAKFGFDLNQPPAAEEDNDNIEGKHYKNAS